MQNGTSLSLRRSSRVPAALSILVTSLDGSHFSEVCQTLVVNAHGCALLSQRKFDTGIPLHFHSKEGRETTAHVVSCQPIGSDHRGWRLGARLDRPENFWGLKECPQDWINPAVPVSRRSLQPPPASAALSARKASLESSQLPEALLDRVAGQLEAQVAKMIGESIRPIQSQVAELKERLARREANPSRFEVSLSSIPPELEEQLQLRLRQDLGPRLLDDSRRQYAQLLTAAKTEIENRTTQAQEDFLRRVAQQLQIAQDRAQELSRYISETTEQGLRLGLEDFHQKLLEGGNSLKQLGEDLLLYLQNNLNEECNARREELEQFRRIVAAESSRLNEHIEYIDMRIRKLQEAATSLESGLDQRLSVMCSNVVKDTRNQLESVATEMLQEMAQRGGQTLGEQLEHARADLSVMHKGIVATSSESLKAEAANSLQIFERTMDGQAKVCVERWRRGLAEVLNALGKSLHEQLLQGIACCEQQNDNEFKN
jgi:hypothetical protein